jgi:Rrf2 family protein
MKIFTKEVDYAVRALLYLAQKTEQGEVDYFSVTTLAGEMGIPLNFLRRICSTLIKAELLDNKEGVNGGIRLIRYPHTITLRNIVELFQEKLKICECTFRKEICPNRKTCVLRRRLLQVEDKLADEFEAITIQSLLDDMTEMTKN